MVQSRSTIGIRGTGRGCSKLSDSVATLLSRTLSPLPYGEAACGALIQESLVVLHFITDKVA